MRDLVPFVVATKMPNAASASQTKLAKACRHRGAPSPRELAEQMMTCIEGGVVLSKAHGDLRFVSQSIRLFRHYLETLCQQETATSA